MVSIRVNPHKLGCYTRNQEMAYHSVTINITNKYLHTRTKFVSKSAILMFNGYKFAITTSTRIVPGTNDLMKMFPQV